MDSQGSWQVYGDLGSSVTFLYLFPSSWVLFEEKNFEADQHIVSEGEFPTLTAMGCLASTVLGSLRKVPLVSSPILSRVAREAEPCLTYPLPDSSLILRLLKRLS